MLATKKATRAPDPRWHAGARMRQVRRQLGLSLAEMGRRLGGRHKATVLRWEEQKILPPKLARRVELLADAGGLVVRPYRNGDSKAVVGK